jgi:hypothetical protein
VTAPLLVRTVLKHRDELAMEYPNACMWWLTRPIEVKPLHVRHVSSGTYEVTLPKRGAWMLTPEQTRIARTVMRDMSRAIVALVLASGFAALVRRRR